MDFDNREQSVQKKKGFKFEGNDQNADDAFLEYARAQTLKLSTREFYQWMNNEAGQMVLGATAWFRVIKKEQGEIEFRAAVNMGAFKVGGQDYTDLISYVVEHEAFEGLQKCKYGFDKKTDGPMHDQALEMEFRKALADGKAERLMEWITQIKPAKIESVKKVYEKVTNKE